MIADGRRVADRDTMGSRVKLFLGESSTPCENWILLAPPQNGGSFLVECHLEAVVQAL